MWNMFAKTTAERNLIVFMLRSNIEQSKSKARLNIQ